MILSRKLELHEPVSDTIKKLSNQIRIFLPRGFVCANRFKLYKSVTNSNNRSVFLFTINGTFHSTEQGTLIVYSIRPSFPVLFASAFLLLALTSGVVQLLCGAKSTAFVVVGMVLNILFDGIVMWQEIVCKTKFERNLYS